MSEHPVDLAHDAVHVATVALDCAARRGRIWRGLVEEELREEVVDAASDRFIDGDPAHEVASASTITRVLRQLAADGWLDHDEGAKWWFAGPKLLDAGDVDEGTRSLVEAFNGRE